MTQIFISDGLLSGKYMMVVGELQESGRLPVVHALKIQELVQDGLTEELWRCEVTDLQIHVN